MDRWTLRTFYWQGPFVDHLNTDTDNARATALLVLARFAAEEMPASSIVETVLIRDGKYAGRAFLSAEFRVVWLCGESRLSLFSADGTLVREFPIEAQVLVRKQAA